MSARTHTTMTCPETATTLVDLLRQRSQRSFDAVGNLLTGSDGRSPLAGGIARRSFDAATISMVRVIFFVLSTDLIRR